MEQQKWTRIIRPHSGWFDIPIRRLWDFRDLIFLFVKRDFTAVYKQTILGPAWHFLQPLLTSFIFTFAFSYIAKIPIENGIPPVLFYLSGIVPWSYFAECTNRTSGTFMANAGMFGKVYFPRMVAPISVVISNMLRFFTQFVLFIAFLVFFLVNNNGSVHPNSYMLIVPVLILIMAVLGMGIGMIVASLTTRYRDLSNLVGFGVQLLMYLSPVIFPISIWPEKLRWIIYANPMTAIIEAFRFGFLGAGSFDLIHLLYSALFSFLIFIFGVIIFNRVEKNFIDTI